MILKLNHKQKNINKDLNYEIFVNNLHIKFHKNKQIKNRNINIKNHLLKRRKDIEMKMNIFQERNLKRNLKDKKEIKKNG